MNSQTQTYDFMGGMPDMTGDWKNYKTGQTVRIKDTIFEDNNLVGVTTDGMLISMDKLRDFVKYDPSKEPSEPKRQASAPKVSNETLLRGLDTSKPTSISVSQHDPDTFYYPEYGYPFPGPVKDSNIVSTTDIPSINVPSATKVEFADPDIDVIHRVIDALNDMDSPVIDVNVKWTVPNSVKFLEEYLHIDPKKISDEVMNQFASVPVIKDKILSAVREALGVKDEQVQTSEESKADAPVEPTGKTVKKPKSKKS